MGMTYCGENLAFYREMLLTFVKSNQIQRLCTAYQQENWNAYRVEVHALKSASLTIGAMRFSAICKEMEQAAKEWDVHYLREQHERLVKRHEELLTRISSVLNKAGLLPVFEEVEIPQAEQQQKELPGQLLLQSEESETVASMSRSSCAHPGQMADILVVDDDGMNRAIAEKILSASFLVDSVSSGKEALSYLEKEWPKLILLDLHMPDMSGFEVMERLQKNPRTKEIPVIFLTADKDVESEVESFQLGAMDFITKPFIKEIMLRRISRIMELDRLQKHLQLEVERQTRNAQERKRKLERITYQVIQALSGTVDAKDRYTNGHSMRVAKYASEIAKRLGLGKQEQENIYYIGMLHDIGKIGVPDEIINKPGRLTEEEFAIIKTHPVIGSEILKNVSEIPGLCLGTRGHHERYDGRGYPDGLAGEQIPLQARIVAVADTYDAMTSHRSYRALLTQDVVREEIVKGKGTQFDPRIADIMLEMIDEDINYEMHE